MEKKPSKFNVKFDCAGREFKAKGDSVLECLDALNITWDKTKLKGIITVKQGSKSIEKLFFLGQLKRIFNNKLTRQMWAKRLESLMK